MLGNQLGLLSCWHLKPRQTNCKIPASYWTCLSAYPLACGVVFERVPPLELAATACPRRMKYDMSDSRRSFTATAETLPSLSASGWSRGGGWPSRQHGGPDRLVWLQMPSDDKSRDLPFCWGFPKVAVMISISPRLGASLFSRYLLGLVKASTSVEQGRANIFYPSPLKLNQVPAERTAFPSLRKALRTASRHTGRTTCQHLPLSCASIAASATAEQPNRSSNS